MTSELLATYYPSLLIILTVFIVGVASPGPATLMILGTAMSNGRSAAVALSLGVVTGSLFWGLIAAFGFVAALEASAGLFIGMKIAGGLYLFYLAFRSIRSALTPSHSLQTQSFSSKSLKRSYAKGLLIHLTNPKAPLVWLATLSVGLGDTAPPQMLMLALGLCCSAAIVVFIGYAFLFSTPTAARLYMSFRRPFDAVIGILFSAAAVKIITSRVE